MTRALCHVSHRLSHSHVPVNPFSLLALALVQTGAVSHVPEGQHAFEQEELEHVVAAAKKKISALASPETLVVCISVHKLVC